MTVVKCKVCDETFPGPDALERHRADCLGKDSGIVFEEPPVRQRANKYVFTDTMQKVLKMRPGEWARILIIESKTGSASVKRKLTEQFGDKYEFRSGKYVGGSAVWARYMKVMDRP